MKEEEQARLAARPGSGQEGDLKVGAAVGVVGHQRGAARALVGAGAADDRRPACCSARSGSRPWTVSVPLASLTWIVHSICGLPTTVHTPRS